MQAIVRIPVPRLAEWCVLDLLSEGVAGLGYLLKDRVTDLDELVGALQTVARGGSALDPLVVEALVARRTAQDRSPLASLTERELDVLAEMATGKNNQAIARVLRISERAVEKHINALFGKLGAAEEPDAPRTAEPMADPRRRPAGRGSRTGVRPPRWLAPRSPGIAPVP